LLVGSDALEEVGDFEIVIFHRLRKEI
jgi:hypothetical protein